jgi:predicted nucleotide-binding protein (sugar kinase/HSP70/actin superfamily)
MKVGIPKALLYYKYYPFIESLFYELGAEMVTSEDTNKQILNEGIKYCVDEACLPIKVFHGHVASIKDKCDVLFIPRIMQFYKNEFICPKFCGLPEMVINSIPGLPKLITAPLRTDSTVGLRKWTLSVGRSITRNGIKLERAYNHALEAQKNFKCGVKDEGYRINIALAGHPYNVYDKFTNMDLIKKLNKLGIGVITEEYVNRQYIDKQVSALFKRPFWTFARNTYGFSTYLAENHSIDGIIYISSFACGIDSVVIELIKDRLTEFPILVLKIDEQTGEAGFDTRIEAFSDMLERRWNKNEDNLSKLRKLVSCSKELI